MTGEVEGPLIEASKDTALAALATTQTIELDATVAVGDGANDLPMLRVAGLSVGFDPKPVVCPRCDVVVESVAELREMLRMRGVLERPRRRARQG